MILRQRRCATPCRPRGDDLVPSARRPARHRPRGAVRGLALDTAAIDREKTAYFEHSPGSRAILEEAARYLPDGVTRGTGWEPYPLFWDRGQGCRVWDVDGVERLDFFGNNSALPLGHAHPAVVEALQRRLTGGVSFNAPHESHVTLARTICERIESIERVRFANSGTEATMNCVHAARAFTGRSKIAKVDGAYHGLYDAVAFGGPGSETAARAGPALDAAERGRRGRHPPLQRPRGRRGDPGRSPRRARRGHRRADDGRRRLHRGRPRLPPRDQRVHVEARDSPRLRRGVQPASRPRRGPGILRRLSRPDGAGQVRRRRRAPRRVRRPTGHHEAVRHRGNRAARRPFGLVQRKPAQHGQRRRHLRAAHPARRTSDSTSSRHA